MIHIFYTENSGIKCCNACHFVHGQVAFLYTIHSTLKQAWPVVLSFIISRPSNSYVMIKFSLIPRINMNNFAMSSLRVLASSAKGNQRKSFLAIFTSSLNLSLIESMHRTIFLLNNKNAFKFSSHIRIE